MAVTRSTSTERITVRAAGRRKAGWRWIELACLAAAGVLVSAGLYLVFQARMPNAAAIDAGLASKQLLNLNELNAREDLIPALTMFSEGAEREFVARKIFYAAGGLSNVGAIARIRVTADEVRGARGLKSFRDRLGERQSMPLLTSEQLRQLKPLLVVRTPARFQRTFVLWSALFLGVFLLAHGWFSLRGFAGDQYLLPAAMLLSGAGLILMAVLRDPVRDTLLFADFAQGVVVGCVALAAAAGLDFERLAGKLSFVPLLASLVLSAALILFGSGPGSSDAKVNLLGFQPVELVRLLLVFFLAGYFATRWDVLRHARERRESLSRVTRYFDIPPVEFTLPVVVCVAFSLVFFFLQKDMGPALVFACLFLALYGIARGSGFIPALGLALVGAGFLFGYVIGVPHTVSERVSMWISPWNNMTHGGDQLAHSLWAYATGGIAGMGTGQGDPQLIPAGHTDLILSALGEEWGFAGIAAVFALYALILWRAVRISLRAESDYKFFLACGLAAVTAFQIVLIAGGSLGVLPLSGVVTPFLSYGRTAMIANFLVLGILLSLSAPTTAREPATEPFRLPMRFAGAAIAAVGAVILAKAAYVQVLRSAAVMGEGTLVMQADGARRYQYNPRFQDVMREIPKGTIYDRNGLPLATSDWNELEKHRAEYQQLGIDITRACSRSDSRHYPFGGLMFDILGDLRTRTRWGASNTSFIERDSARRLRGYDDRPSLTEVKNPRTGKVERVIRYDYRELVPLLRHRNDPKNPEVRKVLDRARDVHTSIDARLEMRVSEILRKQLQEAHQDKGAAVVMDPSTGDLLAAVSYPLPSEEPDAEAQPGAPNPYLDRARYGLYPPGSTFKVVTAMAALRKDPQLAHKTYACVRLPDGRAGNYIKGSKRPIRDDVQDQNPHGTIDMEHGIVVSCNAYFAQLGTYDVGAEPLFDTASMLGIAAAAPNTAAQLKKSLSQSAYGQGQVVASPFQMARVAATVANGGNMPEGRWITDETNDRTAAAKPVLTAEAAQTLGKYMREVVTQGTGRRAGSASAAMAGKTGTAELADAPSHAWFIGFAPYGAAPRKIALSVLVENGVYGGTAAAPAAAEIVNAAAKLGLIQP